MAKSKNESNNKNSGTLLTEKDGTQYFVMGKMCIRDRLGVCCGFLLFSKGFNAVSYVVMVSLTLISLSLIHI